jgi:hypothetical protein
MPACQERVKGNELVDGHTALSGIQGFERTVDHTKQEESTDPVGVVGREAPRFERQRRPTTPTKKETMPDKRYFSKTQHLIPLSQTPVVFPD